MKTLNIITVLLLCLGIFGCKSSQKTIQDKEARSINNQNLVVESQEELEAKPQVLAEPSPIDSIRFERSSCFGTCPAFQAVIYGNGIMRYTGRAFVKNIGDFKAQVYPEALKETYGLLEEYNFWSMEESYPSAATDIPSVALEVWADGKHHKVFLQDNAPEGLTIIHKHLDEVIARAKHWKAMPKQ